MKAQTKVSFCFKTKTTFNAEVDKVVFFRHFLFIFSLILLILFLIIIISFET